jgi:cell division transport system permease protein
MKIRTLRYIVKEGISNSYRNKLMTLASIGIVTASIILFGVFLLLIINMNYNTKMFNEQPDMQAFCEYELDDSQISTIEEQIKNYEEINSYTIITSEMAMENFKEKLGEEAYVLAGFDKTLLSASFVIEIKNPEKSEEVVKELEQISGIRRIDYSRDIINLIMKITQWVNIISVILIVILLVVSVFIISNTIKLTVFARRREIGIMKYVGATDSFIRWPFVVEGVIIGVLASIVAFILTAYAYNIVEHRFNTDLLMIGSDFVKLVGIRETGLNLAGYFLMLGGIVGAVGSFVSIRKYLKV